ncbi:MAG TPA: DUF4157 domain-containing protein [Blastococcus sp.]|jgi:hypothetical protein
MLALQRTLGNAVAASVVTAQRQARDEAGAHVPDGERSSVAGVLRTAGTPLDTPLRQEMEARLGADFADVRVHTGAAAHESAQSVDALAYTSGSHVVFRSGAYNPASAAGKHVLAHELTHVQQQRRGPVPGTNYDGVSVSDPSDAYERAAEANAHRVMRAPVQREQDESEPETPYTGGPLAVQRNVGVELEDTQWTATGEGRRRVEKFTPLVHGPHFQLQGEFAGDGRFGLEMVTVKGGVRTRQEWNAMREGMRDLAARLATLGGKRVKFSTAMLPGGMVGYQLTPSPRGTFNPHLQMTVGVPLAAMPHLFERLDSIGVVTNMQGYQRPKETGNVRRAVSANLGITPSPDLIGFITLLKSYVRAGSRDERQTFLKAVFRVMARTDFASMFSLLPEPEQGVIINNLDSWVTTVVAGVDGKGADAPLVNSWFYDPQDAAQPPFEINTTRRQWLSEMADDPGRNRDLLKAGFRDRGALDTDRVADVREAAEAPANPLERRRPDTFSPIAIPDRPREVDELVKRLDEIYQGLGALGGTTDRVHYEKDRAQADDAGSARPTEAVILEIREPGLMPAAGFAGALGRMNEIYDAVDEAIRGSGGEYQNVDTGNQLLWRASADTERRVAAQRNTPLRQLQARAAWLLRRASAPLNRGGSRR